jgi:hypothetical protein
MMKLIRPPARTSSNSTSFELKLNHGLAVFSTILLLSYGIDHVAHLQGHIFDRQREPSLCARAKMGGQSCCPGRVTRHQRFVGHKGNVLPSGPITLLVADLRLNLYPTTSPHVGNQMALFRPFDEPASAHAVFRVISLKAASGGVLQHRACSASKRRVAVASGVQVVGVISFNEHR